MQDEEIRIACINAVVAWTGSSNKLQDATAFYEWIIAGREEDKPVEGEDIATLIKKIEPTETPFMRAASLSKKGKRTDVRS